MSAESELFASLLALYTADTGSGGLQGSGAANVPFFLSENDGDSDSSLNTPYITVEILDQVVDGYVNGVSLMPFKMSIVYNRDNEKTEGRLAATISRLRVVYHRVALSAGSVWSFSPPTIARIVSADSTGKHGRKVVEFRTTATKNSGV